jgi:hypothetical protein
VKEAVRLLTNIRPMMTMTIGITPGGTRTAIPDRRTEDTPRTPGTPRAASRLNQRYSSPGGREDLLVHDRDQTASSAWAKPEASILMTVSCQVRHEVGHAGKDCGRGEAQHMRLHPMQSIHNLQQSDDELSRGLKTNEPT